MSDYFKFCPACKKRLPPAAAFCMFCGAVQGDDTRRLRAARKGRRANSMGTVSKSNEARARPWRARAPGSRETVGYFATKKEAELALAAYVSRHASDRALWTVKMFFDSWAKSDAFEKLTPSAQASHENAWKYFSAIEDMRMRDVKRSHLQSAVDAVISAGNGRSICEKVRNLASKLCQEAMSEDVMDKNYARLLELPKSTSESKDVFTADEIRILKQHDSDIEAQLILILIYTGMRVSELLQLRTENVDTENWYAVGGLKTDAGRDRIIPIVSTIQPYVANLISDCEWLVHRNGQPIDRNYYAKFMFKRYLVGIGILREPENGEPWRLSPHSTRHTLTSLARKAGIKEDVIARVVGHTTYETTDKHYVQMDAAFLLEEMEKISMSPNRPQN